MELDVIAILISILAFVLSLVQFMRDTSRAKKESTINAFYILQNEAFDPLNELLIDQKIDVSAIKSGDDTWRTVTTALAKIEQFSVGINTKVYSVKILNRVAGAYFIRLFNDLRPVIEKKRSQNISKGKHYNEFQEVVERLKKLRKQRV